MTASPVATPTLAPTAMPPPSASPNPTARPTPIPPTATPTPEPIRSPLPEFPLNVGNKWVYSYQASWDGGQAEFRVSHEVMETREQGPQFAAKIGVTALLLSGSTDAPFMLPTSTDFWYVVDGGNVYTAALPFPALDHAPLEYVFPLPGQWCYSLSAGTCIVDRVASPRPEARETPAGVFSNCYFVASRYLSGPVNDWFCLGTGIVAEQYHHNGTQFDSESVLIAYTLNEP
jgi:hypothetical protein